MSEPTETRTYGRRFGALFAAGLVGILALIPTLPEMLRAAPIPAEAREVLPPMPVMVLLSLIQPTLLMAGAVALGLALAPRLGLRSHLAESAAGEAPGLRALRSELPAAVALGLAADLLVVGLELAVFRPWMGEAGRALSEGGERTLTVTLAGVLYGGITEELMMRWGVMSLLAWAAWKLFRRGRGEPGAAVMWTAILLAAVLFGAGHLGAVSAVAPLTAAVVTRTVVLNAIAGIAFGWLFWRRSLEAAMVAHMSGHVVFTLASWALA
ncbi:MAG TPA: CPBP family intramembrane glutamic endopeptidase [Longimicrobiaceae bacterium]|nr:CPBP family intramembrane glutamic endopeptidase [Longimicrobiaceae bacterium]